MADDKKSPTSALPATGIVWVVIFVAGAFLAREVPWLGSRPTPSEPKAYAYASKQDVDARLWQDPLGAVVRGRADIRKQYADAKTMAAGSAAGDPATERSEHAIAGLRAQLAARSEENPVALVLGVMIPGGAYPESVEYRRRVRYATLAGLYRMGFTPDDPEHVGYVMPPPGAGLPEFIAYEWMLSKDDRGPAVLTLWLDENVFGDRTACRFHGLRELLEGRSATCPGPPRPPDSPPYAHEFVVVGPSYTSSLQDLLRTSSASQLTTDGTLPTFYAYGATADASTIMDSTGSERPADAFRDILSIRKLNLFRTIGVDSALGAALNEELKLRGVDPAAHANCDGDRKKAARVEHVILISERDTLYGRSLPELMSREFAGAGCTPGQLDVYLHRYSYLRGLDGQVASLGAGSGNSNGAANGAAKGDGAGKEKQIEGPEGPGQLDYLRRLSIGLSGIDAELRRKGEGSIKAVGVLGSDVYDKLLILQALRQQFQNVLFFTTDLDARLLHPSEQDWARNLIVASNFGLRLNAHLQRDVLPFRDSYQTSVFLSTQIALHNALAGCREAAWKGAACIDQGRIDAWLRTPRVFEIGRNSAFDFSAPVEPPCAAGGDLAGCGAIHPAGSRRYTLLSGTLFRNAVLLILLAGVLLLMARGFGAHVNRWVRVRAWKPLALCAANLALVLVLAFYGQPLWEMLAETLTEHGAGEPVSFVQGISIWPSEAIRLLAIALSIGFLFWAWRMLDRNLHDIAVDMRFEPTQAEMVRQVRQDYAHWTPWQRFVRCFSFRLIEYSGGPGSRKAGLAWSAQVFWKKYVYQGRFSARACRVTAAVILYLVAAAAVIGYFGAPNTPYRGSVALVWDQLILPAGVALMLFVIFFVVDATVFSHQIIKALQDDVMSETRVSGQPDGQAESLWAASTLAYYHARFGISGLHLDAWILMDFITRRTTVVARLIYFPFIVISLMVLSRSTFFDNWTMPIGLIVVLGSSVLIVSGCAVLLRNSAEDARRKVLKLLADDLIRLKGDEGRTGQQIEAMIAQVRALHEGAFAPFSQQPFFRALLLPLSTFGGSALLDYFTAASF